MAMLSTSVLEWNPNSSLVGRSPISSTTFFFFSMYPSNCLLKLQGHRGDACAFEPQQLKPRLLVTKRGNTNWPDANNIRSFMSASVTTKLDGGNGKASKEWAILVPRDLKPRNVSADGDSGSVIVDRRPRTPWTPRGVGTTLLGHCAHHLPPQVHSRKRTPQVARQPGPYRLDASFIMGWWSSAGLSNTSFMQPSVDFAHPISTCCSVTSFQGHIVLKSSPL
ncbi:uncharacterized protein EI90DRAFT_2539924 [Cantharellus anzutake]|uniref:uncharacterized protein n=1 Tax=Cantharellus anzutake TaxID=1750568 RepID=UPI001906EB1C|nr:uncharacterized protein EI90DRAFT_2539924 [Cantharellus anzutake]KAF8338093.1 hypothetical protein EI90DRAFT_2539924 [Cantharellus anzutake]